MTFSGSKNPIVVLGMYRSGTSCVARCVHELGAYFGPESEHFPADEFNKGGYFEILEMMKLNRKALAFFGMQHFRIEPIPEDWQELPGANLLAEDLASILVKFFDRQDRWGWKEPQASVLLPVYRHVFATLNLEPTYVICVRSPLDVFGSQVTHSHLPAIGEAGVGLWLQYTLTALRESKGARRIVIPYEDFLARPEPYLRRIAEITPGWDPGDEATRRAASTVHPEWRTNNLGEAGLPEWPELVGTVLRLSRECGNNPEAFSKGEFDGRIEDAWQRWMRTQAMVRTSAIPQGIFAISEDGPSGKTTEHLYQPEGIWQTLTGSIPPTKAASVLVDIYQLPSVIWIRKAVAKGGGRVQDVEIRATVHGQITQEGPLRRLVQWGWLPLQVVLPLSFQAETLEFEVCIQWNVYAIEDVVNTLRQQASVLWRQS